MASNGLVHVANGHLVRALSQLKKQTQDYPQIAIRNKRKLRVARFDNKNRKRTVPQFEGTHRLVQTALDQRRYEEHLEHLTAARPAKIEARPMTREDIIEVSTQSQGALTIVKILEAEPLFIVQKDDNKPGYGFCFGSKDDPEKGIVDLTICHTASREVMEENFYELGISVSITEDNIFDVHTPGRNYSVTWFALEVPAGTPVKAGVEQEWVECWPAFVIDEAIANDMFLDQHALAWQVYKANRLHLSSSDIAAA